MKLMHSLHIGETAKIALIVIAAYATIAIVTYLSW
jgi:hypothetical protein